MASTVLPNGIIIPEKYSRDWYADLYHNWQELDNLLGGGTPKDGTLTIQKNGDTVGTFSANQATDETIDITVPDVNNGTLTIQKNGSTVGTFSANQATDETIDITVPDVNNGTLTIQQNGTTVDTFTANSSSDKTVDIQCVDLTSNQTVAGNKEFTGTTTAHDVVPSATDTYNFGSSAAQWNNAYIKSLTINGVACGDILTHNASEFVDVSSNQAIGGNKTFSSNTTFASNITIQGGKKVTCNLDNSFIELDGGTTWGKGGSIVLSGQDRSSYTNSVLIVSKSDTNTDILQYQNGELKPHPNNTNNSALGTSTSKWKSFNGINPGALSLPSGTVGMNLIGDVAVVGAEKKLSKDITVTGFVYVDVSFSSSNRLNLYNDTKKYGIWIPCNSGRIRQIMPISSGDRLEFNVLDEGSTVNTIQIFTCQGNV